MNKITDGVSGDHFRQNTQNPGLCHRFHSPQPLDQARLVDSSQLVGKDEAVAALDAYCNTKPRRTAAFRLKRAG